ncbi:MAG: hypothetical protein J6P98_09225, partial [Clostridia bacterium]|nr:hypothetical protein [Clostridia bacterium]
SESGDEQRLFISKRRDTYENDQTYAVHPFFDASAVVFRFLRFYLGRGKYCHRARRGRHRDPRGCDSA